MDAVTFEIDAQLKQTSYPIVSLSVCDLRLVDDQRWPWLLIIEVPHTVELIDLSLNFGPGSGSKLITWRESCAINSHRTNLTSQRLETRKGSCTFQYRSVPRGCSMAKTCLGRW